MGTRLTAEFLQEVVEKKVVGNVRDGLLKKTTHINLEDKGIQKIENLEVCEHLRVLYLFDNAILRIENLDFAKTLTHLYLQNNLISCIEGLDSCANLSKLYLDGNQIGCVEGLHNLSRLEELSLNRQRPVRSAVEIIAASSATEPGRLVDAGGLVFDMATVAALSRTLRILELADNGLHSVGHLTYLGFLESLVLTDNAIASSAEVSDMLGGMTYLRTLDLQNNPLTKAAKYRDKVILASGDMLGQLDGKEIGSRQRDFLKQMANRRSQPRKAKVAAGGGGGQPGGAAATVDPFAAGGGTAAGRGRGEPLKPRAQMNELSLGSMVGGF